MTRYNQHIPQEVPMETHIKNMDASLAIHPIHQLRICWLRKVASRVHSPKQNKCRARLHLKSDTFTKRWFFNIITTNSTSSMLGVNLNTKFEMGTPDLELDIELKQQELTQIWASDATLDMWLKRGHRIQQMLVCLILSINLNIIFEHRATHAICGL